MPRIRKVQIENFRGISSVTWAPNPGINCLIGPGDSGKSTILDAIDLCLGARRNVQFGDSDFHMMDVDQDINISVSIGELDDALKNLDAYGHFLRGFNPETGEIYDEPEIQSETILTIRLTVSSDLEPIWSLVSDRATEQNLVRNLTWVDRVRISPTKIGTLSDYNLSWRRGSVLSRLSEERADASAAIIKAARDAREAFGENARDQLSQAIIAVNETSIELGIPIGDSVKAMLDTQSISTSGGMISLHDENGIPLRGLGVGSVRLLVAGLQRKSIEQSSIILVDELEYGLEPHRIIRLLGSLGAKENSPVQVFLTTHSPVALRELSGQQLYVVRCGDEFSIQNVGTDDSIQGTIRRHPDAFLAPSVLVCEGATEIGLVRGVDQHMTKDGMPSIMARGCALVDGGGDEMFKRALVFQKLGYRTAVLRDDDKRPTPGLEQHFKDNGGSVFSCRENFAIENELFQGMSAAATISLCELAVEIHGSDLIDAHLKTASKNQIDLTDCRREISEEARNTLAVASKFKPGWFKSISTMERAGCDIIGPGLEESDQGLRLLLESVLHWACNFEIFPLEHNAEFVVEDDILNFLS